MSDYTIIGTVLALAVAILILSGLALYVAFRLRETLRDEKGRGTRAVKVAFLIGLLFLSGGVFYFFASGFGASGNIASTASTSSLSASSTSVTAATGSSSTTASDTSHSASSTTTTSTTSAATVTTTTTTSSSATASGQSVSASPSCPGRVTAGQTFTCQVTVYNQGTVKYSSTTLVSSGDFLDFTILGCTESVNGGSATSLSTTANSVAVGSLEPGTTVLTISVQAPGKSGQYSNDGLTLNAPGFTQPLSMTFSIQVAA